MFRDILPWDWFEIINDVISSAVEKSADPKYRRCYGGIAFDGYDSETRYAKSVSLRCYNGRSDRRYSGTILIDWITIDYEFDHEVGSENCLGYCSIIEELLK